MLDVFKSKNADARTMPLLKAELVEDESRYYKLPVGVCLFKVSNGNTRT